MAQTGFTPILIYGSTTPGAVPSAGNLATSSSGVELGVNAADGKLFYKDTGGVVRVLATTAGSAGDVVGPASSTDNALVRFDSTTGKLVQNSVAVLSDTGDLTGVAAVTMSGALTLSGGTANGVPYLNASKVLTSGSALTFDGTNLGVGVASGTAPIDVASANSTVGIYVRGRSSDNIGSVYFTANGSTGTEYGYIQGRSTDLRIFTPNSNPLLFGISGTERMRLDASGNLGLGITPDGNYTLQGRNNFTAGFKGFKLGSLAGGASGSGFPWVGYNIRLTGTPDSYLYDQTDPASAIKFSSGINFYVAPFGTAGNAISFTQAMTLDASGNLLVGTTSSAGKLTVVSTGIGAVAGRFTSQTDCIVAATTQTSGTSYFGYWIYNNTAVGSITSTGSTTAYNTSSDYRLKNITGPITNSGAYIDSLNPVEGTWKADGSTFVGLIAHEVQEVSRTPVATGEKDGEQMQGMDYSSAEIIANLIAEVKSLRQRVAALES